MMTGDGRIRQTGERPTRAPRSDTNTSPSVACQTILSKIAPGDSKLTYSADQILIHYQKANGITALVVAEDEAGRRMPFAFLADLHRRVRFPLLSISAVESTDDAFDGSSRRRSR
jgi:hypothetical protein